MPGYRKLYVLGGQIAEIGARPPVKTAIRLVLTLLFVVLVNRSVTGADIAALAGNIEPLPTVLAVVLGAGYILLQMFRWRLILKAHNLPSNNAVALRTMFRGFFLGFVTPGRMGELFRAVDLDPKRKLAGITATVEERFCAVVATLVAGIGAMAVQKTVLDRPLFLPLVVASALLGAALIILVIIMFGGFRTVFAAKFLQNGMKPFLKYLDQTTKLPFAPLAVLSLGAHVLLLMQTTLLLTMFGQKDLMINLVVGAEAFSFMLLLPVFIANIGLREFAFAFFLARVTGEQFTVLSTSVVALGVATIILIINIILPAAIGLVWVYTENRAEQRFGAKGDHDNAT